MQIKEHANRVITLFDGRRKIAVAKKLVVGGWQIKGYTISWIDKGPVKNIFGIANPEFLALRSITQVRNLFNDMNQNCS